jgi:predicted nuclease of predicted toxin-antitoxin system
MKMPQKATLTDTQLVAAVKRLLRCEREAVAQRVLLLAAASEDLEITPVAPDEYQVTFTVDAEICEMLDLAKDMLDDEEPNVETEEVLKRALEMLLETLDPAVK